MHVLQTVPLSLQVKQLLTVDTAQVQSFNPQ